MATTTTSTATTVSMTPQLSDNKTTTTPAGASTHWRNVHEILRKPKHPHWVGDGFHVYPVFSHKAFTEELSPLLMFDYAPPKDFSARPNHKKPLGVGQHPHRGFETVTIAFQGEVEHQDSTGKSGVIHPGDVQWMTAGRGILHEEYHSNEFSSTGGTFEMCQLWVNLPQKSKMVKPRYQGIARDQIPVVSLDDNASPKTGATVRLIAGEYQQTKGAAKTHSPVQVWDVHIPHKGSVVQVQYPPEHTCIVFCRQGGNQGVELNGTHKLGLHQVALLEMNSQDPSQNGNAIQFRTFHDNTSILILGGEPLHEPIAAQGPFVMNTNSELQQAMMDYATGKLGR